MEVVEHLIGDVHLAGDAAGVVSSLTAEGIYGALVTGEEVARAILEPRGWALGALARVAAEPALRRPLAAWFLRP